MEKIKRVYLESFCIEAEVADTFWKKARGLILRSGLTQNGGMLFLFKKEGIIPIWMFGMRFPLDIFWINSEHTVVHIEKNVSPWRGVFYRVIWPPKPAHWLLETNAGLADTLGIHEGIKIEIR